MLLTLQIRLATQPVKLSQEGYTTGVGVGDTVEVDATVELSAAMVLDDKGVGEADEDVEIADDEIRVVGVIIGVGVDEAAGSELEGVGVDEIAGSELEGVDEGLDDEDSDDETNRGVVLDEVAMSEVEGVGEELGEELSDTVLEMTTGVVDVATLDTVAEPDADEDDEGATSTMAVKGSQR